MPAVVKRIAHDRFDLWIVRKVTTAAKTMTEEQDQQQAASDDMTKKDAEEMTTACRISHLFVSALLCKLVQ